MRKFLLAAAALLAMSTASNAAIIANLGPNPTSATGTFSNSPGAGAFDDQFLFQLVGGPQFFTIASATNVFPGGPTSMDFITNFTASVFNAGADGVPGGGDDTRVIGPVNAVACPFQTNCQGFAGSAILNAGSYFLDISGIGGGTSGYGGNIATFEVPGPVVGAFGISGLIACLGMLGLGRLRRRQEA